MKVGVLLKQVPASDTRIKINGDASGIVTDEVKWEINPYDEFALEAALQLKEAGTASAVVLLTLGDKDAEGRIRTRSRVAPASWWTTRSASTTPLWPAPTPWASPGPWPPPPPRPACSCCSPASRPSTPTTLRCPPWSPSCSTGRRSPWSPSSRSRGQHHRPPRRGRR
ncbi:MAG: hypothetical protein H6740_05400 [Alphaproteobacteria bacterium]|nr:hypothetical protein [Alphaproteobacteria bacterium]